MKWKALDGSDLHCLCLDDELVVYHGLSGDVHLLGADAAKLLAILRRAPADLPSLQAALADDASAVGPEMADTLGQLLAELEAFALIEPCLS